LGIFPAGLVSDGVEGDVEHPGFTAVSGEGEAAGVHAIVLIVKCAQALGTEVFLGFDFYGIDAAVVHFGFERSVCLELKDCLLDPSTTRFALRSG